MALVALLVIAGLQSHYGGSSREDGGTKQYGQNATDGHQAAGSSFVNKTPKPKPDPSRKEWRAEQDLQAQGDMAKWALVVAMATLMSVGVTTIGVVFVKWTLDATRAAVKEASAGTNAALVGAEAAREANEVARDTAKEAKRQADFAEESFRRLERPYLFVHLDSTSTHMLKVRYVPPGIPFLTFKLVNFGKMPAVLNSISVRLEVKPELPLRLPMGIKQDVFEIVEPGAKTGEMPKLYVEDGQPGEPFGVDFPYLVFHGSYSYEDPTGARHVDRFCMRGTKTGSFVLEGGSEYNYRETEYPKPRSDA